MHYVGTTKVVICHKCITMGSDLLLLSVSTRTGVQAMLDVDRISCASQTHNTQYSSSTIVTDPDSNNQINNVLVASRFIRSALGDRSSSQQRYDQMRSLSATSLEMI